MDQLYAECECHKYSQHEKYENRCREDQVHNDKKTSICHQTDIECPLTESPASIQTYQMDTVVSMSSLKQRN